MSSEVAPKQGEIEVSRARGRPMLQWVGKRPLLSVPAFPAVLVSRYMPDTDLEAQIHDPSVWADWPTSYEPGGLLFHGDNLEVLGHLLSTGFRHKVNLIYIDPPFDSGADYVRTVQLRGPSNAPTMSGDGYQLGEQIQYTDIWSNDNYLQFMYERLLLLKELLAPSGNILLHCDWHRSHHLRSLMDEVFGSENFQNEIIWQRTDPHNDAKKRLGNVHDTILWYSQGEKPVYNWQAVLEALSEAALKEYNLIKLSDTGEVVKYTSELEGKGRRFKLDDCTWKGTDPTRQFVWRGARPSPKRIWPYDEEGMDAALERGEFYLRDPNKGAARCRVSYLDDREGQVLQTIWTETGRMKGGNEYPTEKPYALLSRIIQAFSNPGDIVLDCFVGSGTTVEAAQSLGRRWIACDLNKGAIHVTSKRIHRLIAHQIEVHSGRLDSLFDDEISEQVPTPAQLSYIHAQVNDYDLAIQHNEAVNLACDHLGIVRTHSDSFFDGMLGDELAKIIPFDHPLTPLDLEELRKEVEARSDLTENIVAVCLGITSGAQRWIDEWNSLRKGSGAVNRIRYIELRTDPKAGKFIAHQDPAGRVRVERVGGKIRIEIEEFVSPSIIQRLSNQNGLFQVSAASWKSMVDFVTIDLAYDGKLLNVHHLDLPESREEVVEGTYEFDAPLKPTTVAVRITDMLGGEFLHTAEDL